MGLETGIYINDLVATNPPGTDGKNQGDDHLRLEKATVKNSFAGFLGAVLVTGVDGGVADVYTLTPATALPSYTSKTLIEFTPVANNLTTTPTLNISGLGAKTIKSVSNSALQVSDLVAGTPVLSVYDGTSVRLLGPTKNYIDQLILTAVLPTQSGLPTPQSLLSINGIAGFREPGVKGADIASAGTINLTTATGNYVHVTGTTTITAITIPIGAERTVIFDGALTLTHGAGLLLPGAANITTASNDRMIVRGDTAGALIVDYIKASGEQTLAPSFKLLATLTPTAAANVDFLSTFTSTYDNYLVVAEGLTNNAGASTDQLLMRLANAGAADSGSKYAIAGNVATTLVGTSFGFAGNVLGNGKGITFQARICNVNDSTNLKIAFFDTGCQSAATPQYQFTTYGGAYDSANAVSGFTLYWSGGANFGATGKVRVYGYNNS